MEENTLNFDDFLSYEEEILSQVKAMNDTKGREYARSDDRFANFKRGANKNKKLSPLDVAQIYLSKHLDSIDSFIENNQTYSTEPIHGRIVDAIKYLILIGGMIREQEIERA